MQAVAVQRQRFESVRLAVCVVGLGGQGGLPLATEGMVKQQAVKGVPRG